MTRAHAAPRRRQEPLYDVDVPTPSHAERARTLVSALRTGTLSTLAREPEGHPYGSFVTFGLDDRGHPLFLFSDMAEHTRNLRRDPRASLLVAEGGDGNPLALGRVTLVGVCELADDEAARTAFLERHPDAAGYADFGDFHFWRLRTDAVRYIGGFGRMSWVEGPDWSDSAPDPLAPDAERMIAHMNDDHREAMVLLCRAFTKATGAEEVTMTAIDRYGFEMSVRTPGGPRPIRLAFDREAVTPEEARAALVARVRDARERLGV